MNKLKENIDSLINKYQIQNLENDTLQIIEQLEQLDNLGKINSHDKLNEIYAKMNKLLLLESRKNERNLNNIVSRSI